MPNEDIRLVRIQAENIRKLKLVDTRFDGEPGVLRVTGDIEAGKTTYIDCIAMLFGGARAVKTDTIRRGEEGGWIEGELTNGFTIKKVFTATHPDGYLTVTNPDDMRPKAPQRLLDGWCGPHSLDPGAVLKKRTSEIEEVILSLAKGTDLKADLKVLSDRRAELEADRRPFNSAKQLAERTKKPEGDRPEPVDVSGELDNLKALQAQRQARNDALEAADDALDDAKRKGREADAIVAEISDLKSRLKEREELEVRARQEWGQLIGKVDRLKEAARDLPYDEEGIEATEARISQADTINANLEPWKSWERAKASVKDNASKAEKLTGEIKMIDATKEELLKSADIPVRGIGFDEEGSMVLDGFSIEVASGSRRMDMVVDIAEASGSRVKVVLIEEANNYSKKALVRLHERVQEWGGQVFACRLEDIDGHGEVIIENDTALSAGEVVEEADSTN